MVTDGLVLWRQNISSYSTEYFIKHKQIFAFFIIYHFSSMRWVRQLKSSFTKDKELDILCSQYHGCWWPSDGRSQVFRSHAINLIILERYSDIVIGTVASQITNLTIVYSTVYSGEDQRKHQSSASLAFVWGIHRWPVNSLHKGPETRKMFPFDDVIMIFWFQHQKGSSCSFLCFQSMSEMYIPN